MSVKHEHNTILPNCESLKNLSLPLPFTFLDGRLEKKNNDKRAWHTELVVPLLALSFAEECVFKSYSRQPFSQLLTVILLQQQDK